MKSIIIKLVTIIVTFAAVVTGYMLATYDASEEGYSSIMGKSTLPTINFVINARNVNYTHGYTMDMDTSYMRESLTVVGNTGKLSFVINRYDNNIVDISYEIRTLDGSRLIEDNSIEDWQVEGKLVKSEIRLSSLIKYDNEYILIIKLSTEKETNIRYYTRLLKLEKSDMEAHLEFAEYFSKATLTEETAKSLSKYREYDANVNQDNLGYVDIYCTQDQLSWGNLTVERVTEPRITIKEMYSVFGEYTLEYVVRATNDYDVYQYYNVVEYFRLRQGASEMYVYSYERATNQIFAANTQNISNDRINLGIDSDLEVEHLTSGNGSHVAFVKECNLWYMNLKNNRAMSIFTFTSDSYDDIRDNYQNHGIELIAVDNQGNITFIVYGYMNKGEHEGKNGVSIYKYMSEENIVREILFVESDKTYSILKETAGKLTYVDEKNVVYMMLEDSVFTVNLESNESMQLITGLDEGNFAINEGNNIIAWHENGQVYGATSIRVINLESGDDYKIEAKNGEYVRILDFIGDDLIYGTAIKNHVSEDKAGLVMFPMYKMSIKVDSKQDSEEVYEKEGIYITGIEVEDNMIRLYRVMEDEGIFTRISEDRYINSQYQGNASAELSTIVTTLKKTELILEFAYTITTNSKLKTSLPDLVRFGNAEGLALKGHNAEEGKYYVYARGRMYGRHHFADNAIAEANELYGIVVDYKGKLVWGRILRANVADIPNVEIKGNEKDSPFIKAQKSLLYFYGQDYEAVDEKKTIQENMSGMEDSSFLDFSGGSVQNAVYYIANGRPVITSIEGRYIILTGYKGTLMSIDSFTYIDIESGDIREQSTEELDKAIKLDDSLFYCIY